MKNSTENKVEEKDL